MSPKPWRFKLKITSAEVFIGGPGKNYVTLKIMTDQGIYGLGDATLNTRETLPAAYLTDYLIPMLIGMDPRKSCLLYTSPSPRDS